MTTGWLDAALLGRVLIQIDKDNKPKSLLEEYGEKRRDVFLRYTNRIAIQNRKRLLSTAPEDGEERNKFFERLNAQDMSFVISMVTEEWNISSTSEMS